MWLKTSTGGLNLDDVAAVFFTLDEDDTFTAMVETSAGYVKHYWGHDAGALKVALEGLANKRPPPPG